jgi:hypothetical protein
LGDDAPLFLAGHQPEWFHPGVWIKNFALAGLARRHGGAAVNLIIDTDILESTTLRIPVPASDKVLHPHTVLVPFDRWLAEVPFEERRVVDRELFASFAERASSRVRAWGYEPLLPGLWDEVLRHAGASGLIGESFAAARRTLERAWGCHNLELPLSVVCGSEAFACFCGTLLADHPRFVDAYNDIVRNYRARHRIRSRHHPVPDLARDGDWLEVPFWGWRSGQARRGRLFVRRGNDRLHLRAAEDVWPDLPLPAHPDFVPAWQAMQHSGLKVRSRALTTTLFSRLLLADLFLHGIGGGRYDELTDELIRRFFGIEPPAFLVLSATRLLPVPTFPVDLDDRRWLAHQLRELRYNPQRHLPPAQADSLTDLIRAKQEWIVRQPPDTPGRRERFVALRTINERLHQPLQQEEERTRRELARLDEQLAVNAVLHRRDYAFCLYPEEALRPFCALLM